MSSDTIDWYLESIGRVPLLTADQEITLGRQVQEWMALKEYQNKQEQKATAEQEAKSKDQQLNLLSSDAFEVKSEQDTAIEKLTPQQKKRIMRNGRRAFERMYSANLRLVVSVAKKYIGRTQHLDMLDLIQEGNVGLHRAVEKFDPTMGYKFSTYSYWWIRQGITRAISQIDHTIRLPIGAYEQVSKIRTFSSDHLKQFGRLPSSQTICEAFKLKPQDLERMMTVAAGCVSLHMCCATQRGSHEHGILLDLIPAPEPDEPPFDCIEKQKVEKVLPEIRSQMTEMEGKVFEKAFFTQAQDSRAQIARDLGISGERARQHENHSVMRFKSLFELTAAAAC